MSALGYIANCLFAIIAIVGGYQFYFFVQKRHRGIPSEFRFHIDDLIPFQPEWVWVYSGLYYPIIISLIFTVKSFAQFNYTAFSFITLLGMQLIIFYLFPVKIPQSWRDYEPSRSLSTRFLALVHSFDGLPNSIPSMHVSVATLTALHLNRNLTPLIGHYAALSLLFPVLIGISAVFTKQHYVIDLPAGAVFGVLNFELYSYYGPQTNS